MGKDEIEPKPELAEKESNVTPIRLRKRRNLHTNIDECDNLRRGVLDIQMRRKCEVT